MICLELLEISFVSIIVIEVGDSFQEDALDDISWYEYEEMVWAKVCRGLSKGIRT